MYSLNVSSTNSSEEKVALLEVAAKKPNTKWLSIFSTALLFVSWLIASSTIIIVNRVILVEYSFQCPLTLSALGLGFSAITSFIWCDVSGKIPAGTNVTREVYFKSIVPVGVIQAIALFSSNLLYLYLTVSFIEMSRSFLPIFTMVGLWVTNLEKPSPPIIRAVLITCVGCFVAAYGEANLTTVGALVMLTNLVIESTRLVTTQMLLVGMELHPIRMLSLYAPSATLTLLILAYFAELPRIREKQLYRAFFDHPFQFLLAASLGVVCNILGLMIIKVASATSAKLLAAVRGPIIVLSGVLLFAEHVSLFECAGYSLALFGFVFYNIEKARHTLIPEHTTQPPSRP